MCIKPHSEMYTSANSRNIFEKIIIRKDHIRLVYTSTYLILCMFFHRGTERLSIFPCAFIWEMAVILTEAE